MFTFYYVSLFFSFHLNSISFVFFFISKFEDFLLIDELRQKRIDKNQRDFMSDCERAQKR